MCARHEQVAEVQRRGENADEELSGPRRPRLGPFDDADSLQIEWLLDDDGSQCATRIARARPARPWLEERGFVSSRRDAADRGTRDRPDF